MSPAFKPKPVKTPSSKTVLKRIAAAQKRKEAGK